MLAWPPSHPLHRRASNPLLPLLPQSSVSEATFDCWMKAQSDLVQAAALAYGERHVLDACAAACSSLPGQGPQVRACVHASVAVQEARCMQPPSARTLQLAALCLVHASFQDVHTTRQWPPPLPSSPPPPSSSLTHTNTNTTIWYR